MQINLVIGIQNKNVTPYVCTLNGVQTLTKKFYLVSLLNTVRIKIIFTLDYTVVMNFMTSYNAKTFYPGSEVTGNHQFYRVVYLYKRCLHEYGGSTFLLHYPGFNLI